jgi:hypothetical protein
MHNYVAYGLNINSAVQLPELPPAIGEPDIVVSIEKLNSFPETDEEGLVRATDEEALITFNSAGRFSVRGGDEIIVDPSPEVSDEELRLVVLGPCMGTILYQRGWLPLHASAVATAGEAIAFMAERGWGKSTTAAAMHARGHWLVADDIAALRFEDADIPTVVPGYPQLKLWPEAVAFLGDTPETLPRLYPNVDKRGRAVTTAFSSTPLPLKRIYVLDEGEVPGIETLSPQEALQKLVHHTYGRQLFQTVKTSWHFLQCTRVIQTVPMRNLKRPYSLAALPEVVRLIEEDLAQSI